MATKAEIRLRERLARLAGQQRDNLEEMQSLLQNPDASPGEIERVQRTQSQLTAKQERLMTDLRLAILDGQTGYYPRKAVAGRRTMRELVLNVLEEIGIPAAPRTVSEFAACFNLSLPVTRFSSLRRDEERAFRKDPLSRPAWVTPAINAVGLTAIPRIVTSSAWEDERRVIGARTTHINHLRTLLALLAAAERAPLLGERDAERIWALVSRYAFTIPGALEPGMEPDYERIEKAAKAELERVEGPDLEERRAAAARLAKMPDVYRLWGRPAVIDGAAEKGAV